MKTKQLGNSDLYITPVGFGAWAIGGSGWEFAWGGQDDSDSIAAIHEALDAGVNWIDTAAVYGLGHSEEVVARALEGCSSGPMSSPSAAWSGTSSGRSATASRPSRSGASARPACGGCGVDAIDLYQIHWPDPDGGHRGGLGDDGQAQGRGQGPPYRRVQFRRRPDAPGPGHRPGHVASATATR